MYCKALVVGIALAAVVMGSTAMPSSPGEDSVDSGFIQVAQLPKPSHPSLSLSTSESIIVGLDHAEKLEVRLRHMAMAKAEHKATNDSVTPNYTVFQLDENESEATLQIVKDSMQSFLDQVNTSFHNDLLEMQYLIQNTEACNQDLFNQAAAENLNVTSVNDNVVAAETSHDLCRISEKVAFDDNVTASDALASTVDQQLARAAPNATGEAPELRCMRNFVRPSEPPFTQDYTDPSQYADAVACVEEIRNWSTSFSITITAESTESTSRSQTLANKTSECNTLQRQYEQSFCAYRSALIRVCSELDHCFARAQALSNATNQLILQSNETRFRSFLVAKKVICYVDVLLRNLTIAAIHECDQKQVNTSELDFTFPPLPTKTACNVSLVSVSPCDNEWLQTKYTDKAWYVTGAVQNAPCEPCGVATTTTTSLAGLSTIAASHQALCATTPITPTVSNLKCVGLEPGELPVNLVLGGNPEYVLLGTDRSALEVLGPTRSTMCAKLDNSSIKCWGRNNFGQLGLGDDTPRGATTATMGDNLPVLNLGSNLTILKVVGGQDHACAVLNNGKMKCWGRNQEGQLGRPSNGNVGDQPNEIGDQMPFVDFRSDEEVVNADAGWGTTCAIFKNASLACWGYNGQGMLGRGSDTRASAEPQLVDLGTGHHAIQVAVASDHVCALLSTSKVKCWGLGSHGRLGYDNGDANIGNNPGDMGDNLPTLPALDNVTRISTGSIGSHTCAILKNNGVACWGWNAYGQSTNQNVDATELAISNSFSCARLRSQSIYCWGRLEYIPNYETLN